MNSLTASTQGLKLVDCARRQKKWNRTAAIWCKEALTTRSTLNRFWAGQPIRRDTFLAICQAVGVNWEAIASRDNVPSTRLKGFALPEKIAPVWNWAGRKQELDTLKNFLLTPPTQNLTAVCLVGLAGIGKTTLASQIVRQLQAKNAPFAAAAWESLGSATGIPPRFDSIIDSLLFDLSHGQITAIATASDDYVQKTFRLVQLLKQQPCLVVFDNVETVLEAKQAKRAGYFARRCGEYGWLFEQLTQSEHQSKIIFTSRETLAELSRLQTRTLPVRGLDIPAAVTLLQSFGVSGTTEDFTELARRYQGHPKALEHVAALIQEDFQGRVAMFISDRQWLLIRDLESLIDRVIHRLSFDEHTCLAQVSVYQTSEYPLVEKAIAAQMPTRCDRDLKENIILALRRRHLLDYDPENCSYPMHPLVREKASYLLAPESNRTAHRQAYRYFLDIAKPKPEWKTIEDIKPLLLAHYHATQAQDWYGAAVAIAESYQYLLTKLLCCAVLLKQRKR